MTNKPNVAKAKAERDKQVKRIEGIIQKIKSAFDVKTTFVVHTVGTETNTSTAVLTHDEKTKVNGTSSHDLVEPNEILGSANSSFLSSIREINGTTSGVIPDLITTSNN